MCLNFVVVTVRNFKPAFIMKPMKMIFFMIAQFIKAKI